MNGYYLNEDTSAADSFVHEPIAGQPRFMAVQSQKHNKDENLQPQPNVLAGGEPQNINNSQNKYPNNNLNLRNNYASGGGMSASPEDVKVIFSKHVYG